jgi:hypothetical protein
LPAALSGGIAMNSTLSLGDIDGDGADDLLKTTEDYSYDPVRWL